MAAAVQTPLTLQMVAGDVALELNGRALPYRPLRVGGRQRAEFTWYPGSAAAVVQMLGPEEEPITMNGMWKERFLAQEQGGANASVNGMRITSVSQLVELVDGLRRSGQKFKLSWDRLVRYGHITGFWQTWDTTNDCAWELEFSVSAQEAESQPVAVADPQSVVSAAFDVKALQVPITALGGLQLNVLDTLRARMFLAQQAVNGLVGKITGTATNLTNQVLSPFAAARSIAAAASEGVISVTFAANAITQSALTELFAFTGGQNAAPIGNQVAAASYQRQWRNSLRAVTTFCAVTRYQTEQQLQQDLIAAFVADRELDFRDVAMMFYGTQDGWRDLMIRNGYPTSKLAPGDLVWVTQRAGEGGSAGSAGRPTAG